LPFFPFFSGGGWDYGYPDYAYDYDYPGDDYSYASPADATAPLVTGRPRKFVLQIMG
jgi:hypothetical protein